MSGEIIPSFAFRVKMGKLPSPAEPGAANWNPLYAGINIHKIDIYIDAFKGGATEGLPSRQNGFTKWDAWDYAIVMEGWYKGVVASNNQNASQAWAGTVKKSDRDIILVSDYANNTITSVVSKEALGNPSKEEMLNWDIIVVMTGHDGNSTDLNFGDTRWVDAGTSEWRFGGGNNSDRDANIVDLVASPGFGKKPGRAQADLLNYKTAEAVARVEKGVKAVELEITAFEDQGPPVIDVGAIVNETVPFTALVNAPLYVTTGSRTTTRSFGRRSTGGPTPCAPTNGWASSRWATRERHLERRSAGRRDHLEGAGRRSRQHPEHRIRHNGRGPVGERRHLPALHDGNSAAGAVLENGQPESRIRHLADGARGNPRADSVGGDSGGAPRGRRSGSRSARGISASSICRRSPPCR